MKSKLFTLILVATLISTVSSAKIRRVGYPGTAVSGTDYANLQSAHDAAVTRDTIMLYPGSWSAGISKKLIFIGPGYFLTGAGANSGLQTITGVVSAGMYLSAGADSSVYEGIDGLRLQAESDQIIDKVIIRRCKAQIYTNNKLLSDWQLLQSYVTDLSEYHSGGMVKNWNIANCIIGYFYPSSNINNSGLLMNNVFESTPYFNNGAFLAKNNIFLSDRSNDINVTFQNCISYDYYPLPAGNGNQNLTSTQINNLFVGYPTQGTSSNDGRFTLKTGSLAIGTGEGGINCGVFGGPNPYRLSGIPAIPVFYKLTSSSTTTSTNPYTITFSVKSNN